jgi:hypothetical protein
MLSYLLHLLQPLNVACFALLKRSYSDSILALAHNYIYYISKETVLLAFKAAYKYIFTKENACVGFRGAELVLFNLDVTYSTITSVNLSPRLVLFALKNALSWHCYLNNYLIEFSKNLNTKLHLHKNYYSRPTKL